MILDLGHALPLTPGIRRGLRDVLLWTNGKTPVDIWETAWIAALTSLADTLWGSYRASQPGAIHDHLRDLNNATVR